MTTTRSGDRTPEEMLAYRISMSRRSIELAIEYLDNAMKHIEMWSLRWLEMHIIREDLRKTLTAENKLIASVQKYGIPAMPAHVPGIKPTAKMDTPTGLFRPTCSCGHEFSTFGSETDAMKTAEQHAAAKTRMEAHA